MYRLMEKLKRENIFKKLNVLGTTSFALSFVLTIIFASNSFIKSFEIDDHFDITNYRDEIAEIAKEDMGDISDNVRSAIDDLIDTGKLALTLSNY